MIARLDEVLVHGEHLKTLQTAHELLRTLSSQPEIISSAASNNNNNAWHEVLAERGLEGLIRTCSFHQSHDLDRDCLGLMEKLIELIIV